jgi:hypothetical protein
MAKKPDPTDAPQPTQQEPAEAAASTPAASEQPQPQPTPLLVVRAKGKARRRAGKSFTSHDTVIPLDALSAEQVAAIEGDPELIVQRTH